MVAEETVAPVVLAEMAGSDWIPAPVEEGQAETVVPEAMVEMAAMPAEVAVARPSLWCL